MTIKVYRDKKMGCLVFKSGNHIVRVSDRMLLSGEETVERPARMIRKGRLTKQALAYIDFKPLEIDIISEISLKLQSL